MNSDLNEKQKEAVLHKQGPLLIVAGAGAGKTKTITHRIIELIKSGIAPHQILAITFTNKAAKEMRDRANQLLRDDKIINFPIQSAGSPFISTFHALGVHIIKENARMIGLTRYFTIYDRNDSKRAIKEALKRKGLDPKRFEPGKLLSVISRNKGDFVAVEEYRQEVGNDYFGKNIVNVWEEYEKILAHEKALDFDDLLVKTALLLKNNPDILLHYQNIWQYIHIDEYQDTNHVQYVIAKLLADKNKNICVVGDSDQMIYSWRGATIHNILHFEKDYPNAKVVLLEENYRSTKRILGAANTIIEKNTLRKKKNLFTQNEAGEKIGLFTASGETEEANFIAKKIKNFIDSGNLPQDIAILYRANFQSRALEEAMISHDIPYQVLGVRFFDRKEIKDVLSYIRCAFNPESLADLDRIINVPPRGIGKAGLIKIASKEALPTALAIKYNNFKLLLGRVKSIALTETASIAIKRIIKEIGIEEYLRDGTEEGEERIENIKELATLAKKYDIYPQEEAIERLLADAALATDQDELEKESSTVKLMTVHASKGLEFEYIFITGLEENLFPHLHFNEASLTREEEEEERRLFYVALTRAKKQVILTWASIRTIFGSLRVNIPSQFITDIPSEDIEIEERDEHIPF